MFKSTGICSINELKNRYSELDGKIVLWLVPLVLSFCATGLGLLTWTSLLTLGKETSLLASMIEKGIGPFVFIQLMYATMLIYFKHKREKMISHQAFNKEFQKAFLEQWETYKYHLNEEENKKIFQIFNQWQLGHVGKMNEVYDFLMKFEEIQVSSHHKATQGKQYSMWLP